MARRRGFSRAPIVRRSGGGFGRTEVVVVGNGGGRRSLSRRRTGAGSGLGSVIGGIVGAALGGAAIAATQAMGMSPLWGGVLTSVIGVILAMFFRGRVRVGALSFAGAGVATATLYGIARWRSGRRNAGEGAAPPWMRQAAPWGEGPPPWMRQGWDTRTAQPTGGPFAGPQQ